MPASAPVSASASPAPGARRVDLLVISDLHLGTHDCQAEPLLAYLASIEPGEVILNGDIIDLREVRRGIWPPSHTAVLERLLGFSRAGIGVHYVLGNHDLALASLMPLQISGVHLTDRLERTLDGRRTLFLHGHGIEWAVPLSPLMRYVGGRAYRVVRGIDRLGRWLGIEFGCARMMKCTPRIERHIRDFSAASIAEAARLGCDAVVTGHVHVAALRELEHAGRAISYANSGDWVESRTALEFHAGAGWRLVQVASDGSVRATIAAPPPLRPLAQALA